MRLYLFQHLLHFFVAIIMELQKIEAVSSAPGGAIENRVAHEPLTEWEGSTFGGNTIIFIAPYYLFEPELIIFSMRSSRFNASPLLSRDYWGRGMRGGDPPKKAVVT